MWAHTEPEAENPTYQRKMILMTTIGMLMFSDCVEISLLNFICSISLLIIRWKNDQLSHLQSEPLILLVLASNPKDNKALWGF